MTRLDVPAERAANTWMNPVFGEYLGAEQAADRIRIVGSTLLLPGLLQTDSTATTIDRWVGSSPQGIGAQVSLRLRRQRVFDSLADGGPGGGAHFLLPAESITSNPMGADANMQRHQIDDLLTRSEQDGVSVRILPVGAYTTPGQAIHETVGPDGVAAYTEERNADTRRAERHFYQPGDAEVARYSDIIDAAGEAALSQAASRVFLEQAYTDLGRN